MAAIDLTGTKWVFNDDITPITNNSVFQINFSSNSYNLVALVTGQQVDEYDEPIEGVAFITYYKVYPSSVISDSILSYTTFAGHSYASWSDNSYKTITITGGVDATNATLISWLEANATLQTTTNQKQVDLTTLPGWASLSTGSHNITIVAKAAGYIDSEKSAGVEVTKSASPKTLEESTWAEIAQVSANKSWDAMGWQVGDSKTITLNGTVGTLALNNYQCKVYIIGFDHNAEKEGQGISFGMLEGIDGKQLCLVDQYYDTNTAKVMAFSMNTTNTNAGGWKASKMRKTILGSTDVENGDATPDTVTNPAANTLMAALPADLRAVLKPITKYTDNVGNSKEASAILPAIDYLPLMAEFEIFGFQNMANPNEKTYQAQYEYYKSEKSKTKYKQNDVASAAGWWLRSPLTNNSHYFCNVFSDREQVVANYAYYSFGVAPVFLV